ncbi:Hypothetical predicted protein [Paramuricea clavata]|uniref:Uncharacterized protein n=1 Tax=Paramuricea clavata TaxID=317549 RepID=A0A6S7I2R3_PARCT|nr:Hypothetical predicted protein [Paramuricea clavata]
MGQLVDDIERIFHDQNTRYDANALYLWAIMQDMPTGQFPRRLEEDGFKKKWSGKMAIECLEWQAFSRQIETRHEYNNTEKRIGARRLPVDGFHAESQTVFKVVIGMVTITTSTADRR